MFDFLLLVFLKIEKLITKDRILLELPLFDAFVFFVNAFVSMVL